MQKCAACDLNHPLWASDGFEKIPVTERWNFAKQNNFCWVLGKQPLGILLNKTIFTMNAWERTFFVMYVHAVHAQEYVVLMDAANHTTIFFIESWRSYESRYTKQQQCRTKTTTWVSYACYKTVLTHWKVLKKQNWKIVVNTRLDDGSTKTFFFHVFFFSC